MEETTTTTTTNTETIIQIKGDLGDEDKSGKPVTTVSTICVKCGDLIRLALSLLRRYDKNVLCVDEMKPSFVDVGSNLAEAKQLNDLHKELQSKLALDDKSKK
uniref:Uncharacterized protein n=1 Tax=Romanomermis culicivorax TaxID=13658 RepID=A0A915HUQ5_ROMCU